MSENRWHVYISVMIFLVTVSLLTAISITPSVYPQQVENFFAVSPGEFTASKTPPLGSPYVIPQELVVWNRDNVPRVVTVSSEIPPENDTRTGYEPIPNENWVYPYFKTSLSSSKTIPENSYALIDISFNIPRWENLLGKKWEVWIVAAREAVPPEIALELDVRLKIETTAELPAVGKNTNYLLFIPVAVVIVTIAICVWIWSRRMGEKKPKKDAISRIRG